MLKVGSEVDVQEIYILYKNNLLFNQSLEYHKRFENTGVILLREYTYLSKRVRIIKKSRCVF